MMMSIVWVEMSVVMMMQRRMKGDMKGEASSIESSIERRTSLDDIPFDQFSFSLVSFFKCIPYSFGKKNRNLLQDSSGLFRDHFLKSARLGWVMIGSSQRSILHAQVYSRRTPRIEVEQGLFSPFVRDS